MDKDTDVNKDEVVSVLSGVSSTSRFTPEFKVKAGLFLAGVSGISAIAGFGATLAAAKKADPKYFGKGATGSLHMQETGVSLAFRALGYGTIYAVTGCGLLFYSIWKLSGAKNFEEFRYKVGSALPRITSDKPQGRTEFSGLTDLLDYLQHQKGNNDNTDKKEDSPDE